MVRYQTVRGTGNAAETWTVRDSISPRRAVFRPEISSPGNEGDDGSANGGEGLLLERQGNRVLGNMNETKPQCGETSLRVTGAVGVSAQLSNPHSARHQERTLTSAVDSGDDVGSSRATGVPLCQG